MKNTILLGILILYLMYLNYKSINEGISSKKSASASKKVTGTKTPTMKLAAKTKTPTMKLAAKTKTSGGTKKTKSPAASYQYLKDIDNDLTQLINLKKKPRQVNVKVQLGKAPALNKGITNLFKTTFKKYAPTLGQQCPTSIIPHSMPHSMPHSQQKSKKDTLFTLPQ